MEVKVRAFSWSLNAVVYKEFINKVSVLIIKTTLFMIYMTTHLVD